jgi:uroporphyrinogen decarboxylase
VVPGRRRPAPVTAAGRYRAGQPARRARASDSDLRDRRQGRAALGNERTLLGFAGSPWTVATYMVAGEGSRDQHDTRALAYRDRAAFQAIIDAITATTIDLSAGQIAAGAEAVQLFDSWAGSLAPAEFERWVIAPNAAIVAALKARFPMYR